MHSVGISSACDKFFFSFSFLLCFLDLSDNLTEITGEPFHSQQNCPVAAGKIVLYTIVQRSEAAWEALVVKYS